jgi:hypothetical protein
LYVNLKENEMPLVTEEMLNKWKPVLESEDTQSVAELSRTKIAARLLENQEKWCRENQAFLMETAGATNTMGSGAIATWSPVLIKMAKRLPPMLISMEFFGVQPLAMPDGLVFAMRSRYGSPTGTEALFNEADSAFSGAGAQSANSTGLPQGYVTAGVSPLGDPGVEPTSGTGMATSDAEALGTPAKSWAKMAVSIEKNIVSAKARGLYADYTHELRQDMQAVHGQDVDAILSEMLVTEIQAEMNREFIRTMLIAAKFGATGATKAGVFDVTADTDGRWMLERWKGLLYQIELDANAVMLDTKRGKANRMLVSPNVASALAMAGVLEYNPNLANGVKVDATSSTFAGVLANGMRVHIDPYSDREFYMVGYKGANEMDAGIFFSPYTPLEMYRTVGEDSFNPRIGFKTRYGISANPFYRQTAAGVVATGGGLGQGENGFFRKAVVKNLY